MLFFGWGKRSVKRQIDAANVLLCTYGYFSIMFLFMVTFSYQYRLAVFSNGAWTYRELTKEEAMSLNGGTELKPHWWWQFGLLIGLVAIIILGLLGVFNES